MDCKKCDRKKQQKGWLCGSRQKDRASPEVRGAGILGGWGLCPAPLPVINLQAKHDRFQTGFISIWFYSYFSSKTVFYIQKDIN